MSNNVNYFEIGTPDPAASKAFYSGMFDWPVGQPSAVGYSMVDGDRGGLWDTTAMGAGNWAIFYVQVDDVGTSVEKAVALGASIAVPVVDNGAIEFAHLLDPQGNRFGVWRPKDA
ncbi:bleomycin resistance protein [Arthrobacter livingstonensis]|uniref:Bleomycin resistance protein n=1 Tax=Arthrobacter livingstonensis TaxID=670078 RepID=A0A2V5L4Y8_9MICC|nr:VOC family protein [Arthrobacter livingstonensis]PYI65204.1 bleomycin resistance protein [Arthrobacter livingstonensis]